MHRRNCLQIALAAALSGKMTMAFDESKLDAATKVLQEAVESGQVAAASILFQQGEDVYTRAFGAAKSESAIFLLASITKPICAAAIMSLYDRGLFDLDDPAHKFLPEFTVGERGAITVRQLLTHVSGLPDQLPQNTDLRARHAPLADFVSHALQTPLLFSPGTRYSYSSMGILLAAEIAQRISGQAMADLVQAEVYRPLEMRHSALGLGDLDPQGLMQCQVDRAAAESGAGATSAKSWDWNSEYWRGLGAPWGGGHGSAMDVARFLNAFLHPQGKLLRPETAQQMITNHNPPGLRPRGLGFDLGDGLHGPVGSEQVFGHSGSTGTLCWADPQSDSLCVVLTTLPATAVKSHPREIAATRMAEVASHAAR